MILTPNRHWACPNCKQTAVTHEARPHSQFHHCVGLRGIYAPLIPVGTKARVTAVEREDYIGNEHADRTMAVKTERQDGSNDVAVFAPIAVARTS
jgi:hypothetical protein